MAKKIILSLGCILLAISLAQHVPKDSLERMLESAKEYYNNGEYERAISELEKALQFLKQLKQTDQVEAYKYLAFSYVAFGNNDKAKETFKKALLLNPKLELDPATVSPKIIKVFEEAKAEMKTEPVKPPVTEPTKPPVAKKEMVGGVSKFSARWRSCCFPGWGQYYRGESGKGKKLMIIGGITGSLAVFSTIMRDIHHNNYLDVPAGNEQEMEDAYASYKFWHNSVVFSMVSFLGVYFYNIYDIFFTDIETKYSSSGEKSGLCFGFFADRIQLGYKIKF